MSKKFKFTPEQLQQECDEYFDRVAQGQTGIPDFPDFDGMKRKLHVTDEEYAEMIKHPEYNLVHVDQIRRRRSWLQREIARGGNKNVNGLIKLLVQPENGGIIDKPVQEDIDQEIIVKFET